MFFGRLQRLSNIKHCTELKLPMVGVVVPNISAISTSAATMTFTFGEVNAGGEDTTGSVGCCPVVANAVVSYGTTINCILPDNFGEYRSCPRQRRAFNCQRQRTSRSRFFTDYFHGFFNEDVPANPNDDGMWFSSLRFVGLPAKTWDELWINGFGYLPKGKHTIYWKIWVNAATLTFDSGELLVQAYPEKAMPSQVHQPFPLAVSNLLRHPIAPPLENQAAETSYPPLEEMSHSNHCCN